MAAKYWAEFAGILSRWGIKRTQISGSRLSIGPNLRISLAARQNRRVARAGERRVSRDKRETSEQGRKKLLTYEKIGVL